MTTRYRHLCDQSMAAWGSCVAAALGNPWSLPEGHDAARVAYAREHRARAEALWDAALQAISAGDMGAADTALCLARGIAAEWGDGGAETRALRMLARDLTHVCARRCARGAWCEKAWCGLDENERKLAEAALTIDCFVTFPCAGRAPVDVENDMERAYGLAERETILVHTEDWSHSATFETVAEALTFVRAEAAARRGRDY